MNKSAKLRNNLNISKFIKIIVKLFFKNMTFFDQSIYSILYFLCNLQLLNYIHSLFFYPQTFYPFFYLKNLSLNYFVDSNFLDSHMSDLLLNFFLLEVLSLYLYFIIKIVNFGEYLIFFFVSL